MKPFLVKFYLQYETKAMVCDAGLHGERIGFLNTCSAFVLMLTGSVVAFIIAIQERIIGRKTEFTERMVKKKDTTTLSSDSHRFKVRARTKGIIDDES